MERPRNKHSFREKPDPQASCAPANADYRRRLAANVCGASENNASEIEPNEDNQPANENITTRDLAGTTTHNPSAGSGEPNARR